MLFYIYVVLYLRFNKLQVCHLYFELTYYPWFYYNSNFSMSFGSKVRQVKEAQLNIVHRTLKLIIDASLVRVQNTI